MLRPRGVRGRTSRPSASRLDVHDVAMTRCAVRDHVQPSRAASFAAVVRLDVRCLPAVALDRSLHRESLETVDVHVTAFVTEPDA